MCCQSIRSRLYDYIGNLPMCLNLWTTNKIVKCTYVYAISERSETSWPFATDVGADDCHTSLQ